MFPKDEKNIISKMNISLGDKTIEGKIMKREDATNKYQDAVASGNFASKM